MGIRGVLPLYAAGTVWPVGIERPQEINEIYTGNQIILTFNRENTGAYKRIEFSSQSFEIPDIYLLWVN
jgi:hypothetical protein